MFIKLACVVPVHTGGALSVNCTGCTFGNLFGVFIQNCYVIPEVEFFWKHNLSPVREWKLLWKFILYCLRGAHFL